MTLIESMRNREEVLWINPKEAAVAPGEKVKGYGFVHVKAAQNRFMRFLPYIAAAFPETARRKGVIESQLIEIPKMKDWLNAQGAGIEGRLYLKDDARLPIAGSVKARGGIHEVLKIAETLALESGKLVPGEKYDKLYSEEFKAFFGQYKIQVGSTGNLGISIGRMSARMGFHTIVHMSCDAKQWKKDLLRSVGVDGREYEGNYSEAVAAGRRASDADPCSFFVDDEKSEDLFFGYATAAMRLKVQLFKADIEVDKDHPLFLYLPCGVGGAPGGITFGMKQLFGPYVHCFFAEPVDAPCMTLGMVSGKREQIAVQDIGLSGKTRADGLAVSRASVLACSLMETLMAGAYTVKDEHMDQYRDKLEELEQIHLELSACAGFHGAAQICKNGKVNADSVVGELACGEKVRDEKVCGEKGYVEKGCCERVCSGQNESSPSTWQSYLEEHDLKDKMAQATHIVWGTGGGLEPR